MGQFQHGVTRRTSHRVRLRLGPDEATPTGPAHFTAQNLIGYEYTHEYDEYGLVQISI